MATVKHKIASPYSLPQRSCPREDTRYLKHLQDLQLDNVVNHQRFGVAVFGIGRAGTIHLSYLVKLITRVKILYIVDDNIERLKKVKEYFHLDDGTQTITSADANRVYQDPNVRFVICASPTFTHEKIVTESLLAEKAVFCEKPIAETKEATQHIYELSVKMKQPLFSAFNRRFDSTFSAVRERARRGEIGQILTIKLCSRDSPLPSLDYLKISGGIFHDCAVHDIDMMLYIAGELPTKVSSLAHTNIPEIKEIDDFDTVGILLTFRSGAIGIIDINRQCSYGYDQRLEVFGQTGMLKAENRSPMPSIEEFRYDAVKKAPINYSFASRYANAYKREVDHFLDVLEGRAKLSVNGRHVLAVSKIATAAEQSARTGRAVALEWAEEELLEETELLNMIDLNMYSGSNSH